LSLKVKRKKFQIENGFYFRKTSYLFLVPSFGGFAGIVMNHAPHQTRLPAYIAVNFSPIGRHSRQLTNCLKNIQGYFPVSMKGLTLPHRAQIKEEWIKYVIENPQTVHNVFFDRSFKED